MIWLSATSISPSIPCPLCSGDAGFLAVSLNMSQLLACQGLCICYFLCLGGPSLPDSSPCHLIILIVWLSSSPLAKSHSYSHTPPLTQHLYNPVWLNDFTLHFFHHLTRIYTCLFSDFLNQNISLLKEALFFSIAVHMSSRTMTNT